MTNGTSKTPPFPEIEARWGENPARILIRNLDPRPRLRAIDDVDQLEDWRLVEERCRDRYAVKKYIDQRIRAVEHGERGLLEAGDVDDDTRGAEPTPSPDPTPVATGQQTAVTDGGTASDSPGGSASGSASGDDDPSTCPDCGSDRVKIEKLGGKRGLWCSACSDYTARLDGGDGQ